MSGFFFHKGDIVKSTVVDLGIGTVTESWICKTKKNLYRIYWSGMIPMTWEFESQLCLILSNDEKKYDDFQEKIKDRMS